MTSRAKIIVAAAAAVILTAGALFLLLRGNDDEQHVYRSTAPNWPTRGTLKGDDDLLKDAACGTGRRTAMHE